LLNLRHPLIAPLIGFVFPIESDGRWELKTARLHASGGSLADVLANPPAWWTPTAKAKAVVGIALGLRFAHGLGLLHGAVKAGNVLFDADRRIQIADFSSIRLERGEVEPFSGEKWMPTADVWVFVSLLSEIAIDAARALPVPVTAGVPLFVCFADDRGRGIARISVPPIVRRYRQTPEGERVRNCGGRRF
jgi:serine/threonine protein kinase